MNQKVLVAYFSASGTTKGVAQQLADVAGNLNWKEGKLLNRASKAELQKWVDFQSV